jgi:hypothetical protein
MRRGYQPIHGVIRGVAAVKVGFSASYFPGAAVIKLWLEDFVYGIGFIEDQRGSAGPATLHVEGTRAAALQ